MAEKALRHSFSRVSAPAIRFLIARPTLPVAPALRFASSMIEASVRSPDHTAMVTSARSATSRTLALMVLRSSPASAAGSVVVSFIRSRLLR